MMGLKRLSATNFKSFRSVDFEPGEFSLLIGANAAGKSNFVQIFRFIRDISLHGLDNAISLQGGWEFLKNQGAPRSEAMSLEVTLSLDEESLHIPSFVFRNEDRSSISNDDYMSFRTTEITYSFSIVAEGEGTEFRISKQALSQRCELVSERLTTKRRRDQAGVGDKSLWSGEIFLTIDDEGPRVRFAPESELISTFLKFMEARNRDTYSRKLMLEGSDWNTYYLSFVLPPSTMGLIGKIAIYDFDPRLSKKSAPVTGRLELEEDGSNLAIVLRSILNDAQNREKLTNILRNVLPFVEDISVDRMQDKSLLLKLREKYSSEPFPAYLVSDGTIDIADMVVALYFQRERSPLLTVMEEPERNIHPHLISKVVGMMKEVSNDVQLIVTTHSPEVLKHVELSDIHVVVRDEEGCSRLRRPVLYDEIKALLSIDMGIDDLYVQNLLEAIV